MTAYDSIVSVTGVGFILASVNNTYASNAPDVTSPMIMSVIMSSPYCENFAKHIDRCVNDTHIEFFSPVYILGDVNGIEKINHAVTRPNALSMCSLSISVKSLAS